jgi:hypothetical protein
VLFCYVKYGKEAALSHFRYHWRSLEKVEVKPCTKSTGGRCAKKPFHLASCVKETHPLEHELLSKKRMQSFVHQVEFSLLSVVPVKRLLRRVHFRYTGHHSFIFFNTRKKRGKIVPDGG